MKRFFAILLATVLMCGCAQAALDANSFFDDSANSGRFDGLVMAEEYVYWLHEPNDALNWQETPADLYRMKIGRDEAELVLQGREDFWIQDVCCIGERLLLSVSESQHGQAHPAILNPDGNAYKMLNGNIGSVVVCCGTIYNSVDGAIYEIEADTLKPKKIYSYPATIAAENPILFQCEGLNLYFVTDTFEQYRLDLQFDQLHRIDTIRGDGFVRDFKFYVSDYDHGGTYRYDLAHGIKTKISDHSYMFLQGSTEGYVRAKLLDPAGLGSSEGGRIFDLFWMQDDLEDTLVGTCDPDADVLLNGELLHYDETQNCVRFSLGSAALRLQNRNSAVIAEDKTMRG